MGIETAAAGARRAALKAWRSELGESLGLDPPMLWPMSSLQRLSRAPDALADVTRSAEVRQWQRAEFGDAIRKVLG